MEALRRTNQLKFNIGVELHAERVTQAKHKKGLSLSHPLCYFSLKMRKISKRSPAANFYWREMSVPQDSHDGRNLFQRVQLSPNRTD